MHRFVELELEEVDSFLDEQLLRKANVSPFFASSRPPFGMLSDLDFSPQAISPATDDIATASTSPSHFGSIAMQPLDLDHSNDFGADSGTSMLASPASLATGGFEATSSPHGREMSRVPSWQPHLDYSTYDNKADAGDHHTDSCAYDSHRNSYDDCSYDDDGGDNRSNDGVREGVGCTECAEQQRALASDKAEPVERHGPFADALRAMDAAAHNRQHTIMNNDDSILFPFSSRNRGDGAAWSPSRYRDEQKVRREKLFPQHRDDSSGYLVPKPIAPSSNLIRLIPFPTESLSLETSSDSGSQYQATTKQSPLPDALRTVKTWKATRSPVFSSSSPMTELTRRYARHSSDGFSTPAPNQPSPHLLPALQRADLTPPARSNDSAYRWSHSPCASPYPLGCCGLLPGSASVPSTVWIPRFERTIGIYPPEARRARIKRYHEKRKHLVFSKRVTYDCRKRLASVCPRVKGRFVKRGALEIEEPASSDELLLDIASP